MSFMLPVHGFSRHFIQGFSGMRMRFMIPSFLALLSCGQPASAGTVFYDSMAAFQSASSANLAVTFDGFSPVNTEVGPAFTTNGVTFASLDSVPFSPNLIVATPDGPFSFGAPLQSRVVTSTGNEHFSLAFDSPMSAVGFDTYTNAFAPPVVSVYDTRGNLIGQDVLSQSPDSLGFIGVVSTVGIGRVEWQATGGEAENTAIGNVRLAPMASAVPEPSGVALAGMGIVTVLAWKRWKR